MHFWYNFIIRTLHAGGDRQDADAHRAGGLSLFVTHKRHLQSCNTFPSPSRERVHAVTPSSNTCRPCRQSMSQPNPTSPPEACARVMQIHAQLGLPLLPSLTSSASAVAHLHLVPREAHRGSRRRPPSLVLCLEGGHPHPPVVPPPAGSGPRSRPLSSHEAARPDDEGEDDGDGDEDGGHGEDDPEEGAEGGGVAAAAAVDEVAALVAHLGQLGVVHLAGGVLQGEGAQHLLLTLTLNREDDRYWDHYG